MTMSEWFGLKEGHKDFIIENDAHARLLFARSTLDDQILSILRKSFRTGNPPKLVLYGEWGIGKTHVMRHIDYVVQTTPGFSAMAVFSELPDITSKATFQAAHSAMLDATGFTKVQQWMFQYQAKYQSRCAEILQKMTQSGDIAKGFLTLCGYGEASRIAWDWLRGISLSATDARGAGLPPNVSQSNHLVAILRVMGMLSQDIENKMLILMLDETTKLRNVTSGDAISHWVNAFKLLSDNQTKEVGFIVAGAFNDPDDMVDCLSDMQIQTRFGQDHYIHMTDFNESEVQDFLRALFAEWIDSERRLSLISTHNTETEGEAVAEVTFPFTEPAFALFVQYACQNGGVTTPRKLQSDLDKVLNRAIDDERHILSSQYLNRVFAGS